MTATHLLPGLDGHDRTTSAFPRGRESLDRTRVPASRRRASHRISTAVVVAALAVLLLAAVPVSLAPASGGSPVASTNPVAAPAAAPAAIGAAPVASCNATRAAWATVAGGWLAPAVAPSLQSSCPIGRDAPALYLVSPAADSGARFEMLVSLPGPNSSPASSLAAFWVGMWVTGIPCSFNGAAYLTVELLPPGSGVANLSHTANWSLSAPVWDLVTPGTCDSQCENSTAYISIAARSYCEEDAILSGVGALNGVLANRFAPGSVLSITFDGTAGGSAPLEVYVNDSLDPAADAAWSYSGGIGGNIPGNRGGTGTVSGAALTPLYSSASLGNGGWTGGLDVGFGWVNCPDVPATSGVGCNSYDSPVTAMAGAPEVDLVASWNQTRLAYANPYPSLETMSPTGACSGSANALPCADFTSAGGTGAYPLFTIDSAGGRTWLAYGAPGPDTVGAFGGAASQFPANGNLSALEPITAVSHLRANVTSTAVTVAARLSDPYGVAGAEVSSWWCGPNASRRVTVAPLALSGSVGNSPNDGNWSAAVATGGYVGQMYYSLFARSQSGALVGPISSSVTVTGPGTTCGASPPPAPLFSASNASVVGGGYLLDWSENATAGVEDFHLLLTPSGSGSPVSIDVGDVTRTRVSGLAGNTAYSIQVIAVNPALLTTSSPTVSAPATYLPLATKPLVVTASSSWVNQTSISVLANATGGEPPFTFLFSFGDGSSTSVFTTSGDASVTHDFAANYSGVARIAVSIADSLGDTVTVPAAYVPVQATPLGVDATFEGGTDFVHLAWKSPVAPPTAPTIGYTVFWTTDPGSVPYLTATSVSNRSFPAVHSVVLGPTSRTWESAIPDGTTAYAQVVAWNQFGAGLLPPSNATGVAPVLAATPGPFVSTGIQLSSAGGPAPFSLNLSAAFTAGSGTTIVNGTFRFSDGSSATATVSTSNGLLWVNATHTFETPGARTIYLYVLDSVSEAEVLTSQVLVEPGVPPLVTLSVSPTPAFVGGVETFTAAASGGSGSYEYLWNLGSGPGVANTSTVSASYPAPGSYVVRVTVIDTRYGGTATAIGLVTVYSVPTVEIGVVPLAAAGEYSLAAFTNGGYGNFSYTWLFGDGTQGTGVNVTHTWAASGRYVITLRLTDQYGHTTVATTNLTVALPSSPSGSSGGGSGAYDGWFGILLAAVVVLAAALGILLLRQRRRPPPSIARSPSTGYDAPAPAPALGEELPAGPPRPD